MKIALAQIDCHIGNFESNTKKIISYIEMGKADGVRVVIFPELAICGYPPLDFLDYHHFNIQCRDAINQIATHCEGITAIVGGPFINPVPEGKNLYNAAFVLENGEVKSVVCKTLLPTYDVFDEYRYFEPNHEFSLIEIDGQKMALTICEDLWNEEDDPMYRFSPMDHLMKQNPALIINIAASPFDYLQREKRQAILQRNATKFNLPVIYVNHAGAQTDILFDGGSLVMNPTGEVTEELNYFNEDFKVVDTRDFVRSPAKEQPIFEKPERIYRALVMGIKGYFNKMNFRNATLGLSGGVDSALVLKLAVDALGADHVFPVMMPSPFSSSHSISDSVELCKNLGIQPHEIPIQTIYDSFLDATQELFAGKTFDVTEENIQARIRGTLLMALSNKNGYILFNTSNKSELAVGYGTLYGDMAGGLSVIGDLYKTEVYELCRYINKDEIFIPENILTKAPSAELRPGQFDTDSLPPYEILDEILRLYRRTERIR
jgi:NAD+ synthase (glutamine-hydrolysing)